MLGEAQLAQDLANRCMSVYVTGFFYRLCQRQARIRTQMSAALTTKQLDQAIAAFTQAGKELEII